LFGETLIELKKSLKYCENCFNITEESPCEICRNPERDKSKIMVVEETLGYCSFRKNRYKGKYHVLGGVISPIEGIGPENLRILKF